MTQPNVDESVDEFVPADPPPAFQPRPAARSLQWKQLVRPTQEAVAAVLRHMDAAAVAAQDSARKGDKVRDPGSASRSSDVSTSLLVTGQRGSGKTTVLLSSRFAIENWESFFEGIGEGGKRVGGLPVDRLRGIARDREQQVVWLDVLDLESLPPKANLLATLLVRVRAALGRAGERASQPASLYEQSADDCWSQIDQLVKDATLMWDNVFASDSRQSANEQIRVAEIYADFRKRFTETMEEVCAHVSGARCGHCSTGKILMVLPVDNVDRSSHHLHAIMKLTQMVACRQLWLILAAGHDDFQVLLERAFQGELAAGHSASRPSRHGEDEALEIARRQAAATQRQLLPPTQRVSIRALSAREALAFDPDPLRKKPKPLEEMLSEIPVRLGGEEKGRPWLPGTFLKLLLEEESKSEDRKPNEIGLHALTLPARNVVDLWQIVAKELERPDKDESAIRIAARMLHDAVEESELPNWAVKVLNESAVMYDSHHDGRVAMELSGYTLYAWKRFAPSRSKKSFPKGRRAANAGSIFKFATQINTFYGFKIELRDGSNEKPIELPPEVEGWFALLYDMLQFVPEGRVIGEVRTPKQRALAVAWTVYTVNLEGFPVDLILPWLTPLWPTYFERLLFLSRWAALSPPKSEKPENLDRRKTDLAEILNENRLWHLVWIDTACSFASVPARGQAGGYEAYPWKTKLAKARRNLPKADRQLREEDRESIQREILGKVSDLYGRICESKPRRGDRELKSWLEVELWLLLRSVPIELPVALLRETEPASDLLVKFWEDNQLYLEARWRQLLRAQLAETDWYEVRKTGQTAKDGETLRKTADELAAAIAKISQSTEP